jgi:DNA-binding transcriptional regulator YdaS (Cro superfamily)
MVNSLSPAEALAKAVEAAGGQAPFARIVEVTQGAIWQRLNANKPAAAEWVLKAEAATGISRHDLRPDIYPIETVADAQTPVVQDLGGMERAR